MRVAVLAFSALLLAAGCASAPQGESAASQTEAGGPSASSEKLICRQVTDTGSRRPRKVCATAAEWEKTPT